jgi:hypothetical protein
VKTEERKLSKLMACSLFLSFVFLVVLQVRASAGEIAEREVLANGMTVLVSEKKALPIVRVVVAIKAGSITEPREPDRRSPE